MTVRAFFCFLVWSVHFHLVTVGVYLGIYGLYNFFGSETVGNFSSQVRVIIFVSNHGSFSSISNVWCFEVRLVIMCLPSRFVPYSR